MKKKAMVLCVACIAMTAAASAQQVTGAQKVTVRSGGEVKASKAGTSAKADVRAAHSGSQTVKLGDGLQGSAASEAETRSSVSGEVKPADVKPVVEEAREAQAGVRQEAGAVKGQVQEEVDGKVDAAGKQVKEAIGKTMEHTEVAADLAADLAAEASAGVAGEVPVKTAGTVKSLVNGSLKSASPAKLKVGGTINNTLKVNAVPIRAQVRNITAGRIGIL